MLEFKSLSKVYPDGTRAANNVCFSVPEGQFCVLLGPSGAGKSTLLKTCNGLTDISYGSVEVDGIEVSPKTLRQARCCVGMIHQHFNLVPRLSVERNVLTGALQEVNLLRALLYLFPDSLRRKACELLASVGLEEQHLNKRACEMSGGQQQRIGIARAFILDPKIVLADEPVASLDPKISRDVLEILFQAARERGTTVLCSLHQVDLAEEFGDRIVAMKKGEVVFDGKPGELSRDVLIEIYGEDPRDSRPCVEPQARQESRRESVPATC